MAASADPVENPPNRSIFALHEVFTHGPVHDRFRRAVRRDIRDIVIEKGSASSKIVLDAIETKLDKIQHELDPRMKGISVEIRGAIAGKPVVFNRPLAPYQPRPL